MADEKKPQLKVGDVVELVAVERGFVSGRMVEPGRKFPHTVLAGKDGAPRLPKWAQLASSPLPAKVTVRNGDLKPSDAQKAVAAKAGALSAGTPPGGVDGLV